MERLTFGKEERLHHRSLVEGLFRKGKSFYEFPFKVVWRKVSDEELIRTFCNHPPEGIGSLQMMVTVPKKKRRKAVERVRIRRRIRESYRLNRMPLFHEISRRPDIKTLSVAFIYIHDQELPYSGIEDKMKKALAKIAGKITTGDQPISEDK